LRRPAEPAPSAVTVLYYDCFAGISGDMHLGALVDLGVDEAFLRATLARVPLAGYALRVGRARRSGVAGTRVEVVVDGSVPQPLRHLGDVLGILAASDLPARTAARAREAFERLARAEARVHDCPLEEVHFHEVGAADAIVDVVGGMAALEALGVERVLASTVELGGGTVVCAHGRLPVPAPATAELLRGAPTRRGGAPFEATTPTGAALLATLVEAYTDTPALRVERIGYGLGAREGPLPNALRVFIGEEAARRGATEPIVELACNIDDMSPEIHGYVLERLLAAGAADAWLTPLVMKKGRPGTLVSAVCAPALEETLTDLLLAETTTLGVRRRGVERTALAREVREVVTRFGPLPVKVALRDGEPLKAKPEYEACRRVAEREGIPLREVYDEVFRELARARDG
jgi:hypothetical protein